MADKLLNKKVDNLIHSVDDLARMTQNGFQEMDKKFSNRFDDVDKRLDRIDNRLDLIESELHDVKEALFKVIYRHEFELLKDRVTELEKKLAEARKK